MQGWRRVIEKNRFGAWAELKRAFNTIDKVGELTVFDIGGNKYWLITYIRFEKQIVYLREIGSQGVVPEILADKQNLNFSQVRALGKRFGSSPAIFL
ncbi:MAG: type II toxin-antitoxin system HigB family toxin [Sterolibacterium sp.]|nr:type II toxin-antitoxin system HigB family toxin [Sterolibacterium sp.]